MSRRARIRETARESKRADFFSAFGPPEGDEDDEGGIDVEPCSHCDDTGDVHRADGVWFGVCTCGAGMALLLGVKHG